MNNRWTYSSIWPSSLTSSLFSIWLAGLSFAVAAILTWQKSSPLMLGSSSPPASSCTNDDDKGEQQRIRIACLGNSIQYFNDCPRLLERMFQAAGYYDEVYQNSCLRGGASIVTLWHKGNGMQDKFNTPNAQRLDGSYDIGAPTVLNLLLDDGSSFDYVIINDHTQSPARPASREATIRSLREKYVPILVKSNTIPILLQTAAYRSVGVQGSSDLGDFDHYTKLLQDGYHMYKQELDKCLQQHNPSLAARIAPVGLAYSHLYHSNRDLWERLYHTDDFHPSPHGTLLQAFVLYMTITQQEPPANYDESAWWERARRMQPPPEAPLVRPTPVEAEELRKVAIEVYQSIHTKV